MSLVVKFHPIIVLSTIHEFLTSILLQFNEEGFQLRTPAAFTTALCLVVTWPSQIQSHTETATVLNDIEHFHVASMMQMPQDVMHILFEGYYQWKFT